MITDLNFAKYKRFFAFGCSFTQYLWPTWADLIANEISESYNYGRSGAGNMFIFNSLMEAHARHNFNSDDLIIVMWTSVAREDRYRIDGWHTPGNIYTQPDYSEDWIKKFVTMRGCFIRDSAAIYASMQCLEQWGCDYDFLSMTPIKCVSQYTNELSTEVDDVYNLYSSAFEKIKPSIFEIEYNYNWHSRKGAKTKYGSSAPVWDDLHPIPNIHLSYIEKSFSNVHFSENTKEFANAHSTKLLDDNTIVLVNYDRYHSKYPVRL